MSKAVEIKEVGFEPCPRTVEYVFARLDEALYEIGMELDYPLRGVINYVQAVLRESLSADRTQEAHGR